jgi:hypothetical protein
VEGLGQLKSSDVIGNRTREFPAYNVVPNQLRYRMPPPPKDFLYTQKVFAAGNIIK